MIHNAADNSLTELGSPMSAWNASLFAGMTDDASVVATSFQATAGGAILGAGYIHNAHGWFQLNGILRRAGIDLRSQGWDVAQGMNINGLSGDGTLLFGMMRRNGNFQGFVLEFPAGYLANYHPTPTPVADTSIVGAWTAPGNAGAGAIIFMTDGTYVQIATNIPANPTGTNGFERGFYIWDSATGHIEIDTIVDTNGDEGLSESNDRHNITVSVVGDTLTATVSPTNIETFVRLPTDLTTFVGTWVAGDPRLDDQTRVFVFLGDGTYYMAEDGDPAVNGFGGHDGIESGTFSIDPLTGIVTANPAVDTNGDWGLSHPIGVSRGVLGPDGLTAMGGDDSGSAPLVRVIDPNAVRPVVSSQAPFTLTLGQPFSSLVTATFRPSSFTATGLPAGLTIDGSTGMISGAATTLGSFDATISAANSLATGSGAAHFDVRPITCGPGSHLANPTDLTCTPDNRAPVCSAARATTPSIWPVNHQWVAEGILGVADADGTDVRITITGIFQDEAVNEEGSGDTRIDGTGVGTSTAFVRAEREGDDNGRVYHIRFVASDGQANCTGEVTVSVPHDRAHAAVDDGPRFDSTVPAPAHRGGDNCDHERGQNGHRKGDGCEHDRGRR